MNRRYLPTWTSEPQLALIATSPATDRGTWHRALALTPRPLDTSRWQRRSARGFAWHCDGIDRGPRVTH
jgi:hypothetical protein